jgi:hypothetical protein
MLTADSDLTVAALPAVYRYSTALPAANRLLLLPSAANRLLLLPPAAKPTPYCLTAFLQRHKHKEELPEASYRA